MSGIAKNVHKGERCVWRGKVAVGDSLLFPFITLFSKMERASMSVLRWQVADGNMKFMLVKEKKCLSTTECEIKGFEMRCVGKGCKNALDTQAYPNAFGIDRLTVVNEVLLTRVVSNAMEVFVVLESIVTGNKLFAIADMMLPLYIVNDGDCQSFRTSFELNFNMESKEVLKEKGIYERHVLFNHYMCN